VTVSSDFDLSLQSAGTLVTPIEHYWLVDRDSLTFSDNLSQKGFYLYLLLEGARNAAIHNIGIS